MNYELYPVRSRVVSVRLSEEEWFRIAIKAGEKENYLSTFLRRTALEACEDKRPELPKCNHPELDDDFLEVLCLALAVHVLQIDDRMSKLDRQAIYDCADRIRKFIH